MPRRKKENRKMARKEMTRNDMLRLMYKKANELQKNYTWQGWEELWSMSSDWNSTHDEREEIAMYEHDNEETELVDGFYIEDDLWILG